MLAKKIGYKPDVTLVRYDGAFYVCKVALPNDISAEISLSAKGIHSCVPNPRAYVNCLALAAEEITQHLEEKLTEEFLPTIEDSLIEAFTQNVSLLCVNNSIPVSSIKADPVDKEQELRLDIEFKDGMKIVVDAPYYIVVSSTKNREDAKEYMLNQIVSKRIGFTK